MTRDPKTIPSTFNPEPIKNPRGTRYVLKDGKWIEL